MKNTLINISENLPQNKKCFYKLLNDIMVKLNVPYFIVGASARDLHFEYAHNIKPQRATLDTDIAIFIDSWDALNRIREEFESLDDFMPDKKIPHRIVSLNHGPIDIIPFGEIERDHKIAWPPDFTIVMNTLGFHDAFVFTTQFKISNDITINVASLEGIAVLKLIAWQDRPYLSKDIKDLLFIMDNYLNAGNLETLHDEHRDLIGDDFDYEIASARMLGRGIAALATEPSRIELTKILNSDAVYNPNKKNIYNTIESIYFGTFVDVERILCKFKALKDGYLENSV